MTTGINNTHQPSAEDFNNFSESVILYIKNKRDEQIKDERPVLKFLNLAGRVIHNNSEITNMLLISPRIFLCCLVREITVIHKK